MTSRRWAISGLGGWKPIFGVFRLFLRISKVSVFHKKKIPLPSPIRFRLSLPRKMPVSIRWEERLFQSQILLRDRAIVDTVEVYYRGISDTTAFELGQLRLADDWYVFDIDSTHIDDIGVEYYFLARGTFGFNATSDTGYTYIQYPNGLPYTYNDLRFGKDITDYNIISFPLVLDNNAIGSVLDELGAYDIFQMAIFSTMKEEAG